jgi:hypothetical protein
VQPFRIGPPTAPQQLVRALFEWQWSEIILPLLGLAAAVARFMNAID